MSDQRMSAGFRDVPVFEFIDEAEIQRRRKARAEAEVDLAVTPNGRPADTRSLARPGYKGPRRTTDYERAIVHALMRKGHGKSKAIRMARGLLNKAAKTGRWGDHGKAGAKTRAGAVASIAQRKTF